MAQIRIYGTASFIRNSRSAISDATHSCVVEALAYLSGKRAHDFFTLKPDDFIYPPGRSEKYIIIEISMFEGRSVETKKKLIKNVIFPLI